MISLRSKRFRLASEQRNTEEGDFRFWPREKWNEPLVPRSFLLNRTETLATQAMEWLAKSLQLLFRNHRDYQVSI